ncbi:MAG: hypothetical protein IKQ77_06290 [Prevotella sp.]|nr:hypothetical protein [Prevotella sp.]
MKRFFLFVSRFMMGVMMFISFFVFLLFINVVIADPGYGCATSLGIAGSFFFLTFMITMICFGFWKIMEKVCSDGKRKNGKRKNEKSKVSVPVVYLILTVLVFIFSLSKNEGHRDFRQSYEPESSMELGEEVAAGPEEAVAVEYENVAEAEPVTAVEVEPENVAEGR